MKSTLGRGKANAYIKSANMEFIMNSLVILFKTLTCLLLNTANGILQKISDKYQLGIILSSYHLARVVIKQNNNIHSGYVEVTFETMDEQLEQCENRWMNNGNSSSNTFCQVNMLNVFEFIEPDTYISMASDDYREPLYFAKVIEKNVANDEIHDRFGHTICTGQRYINMKYLRSIRSKKQNYKQYSIIMDNYVFIKPDEVFELFVEINQDLSIKNDVYMELVRKSQDY